METSEKIKLIGECLKAKADIPEYPFDVFNPLAEPKKEDVEKYDAAKNEFGKVLSRLKQVSPLLVKVKKPRGEIPYIDNPLVEPLDEILKEYGLKDRVRAIDVVGGRMPTLEIKDDCFRRGAKLYRDEFGDLRSDGGIEGTGRRAAFVVFGNDPSYPKPDVFPNETVLLNHRTYIHDGKGSVFISSEWPELKGKTQDDIDEIIQAFRDRVKIIAEVLPKKRAEAKEFNRKAKSERRGDEYAGAKEMLPKTDEEISKFDAIPIKSGYTRVKPIFPVVSYERLSYGQGASLQILVQKGNGYLPSREFTVKLTSNQAVTDEYGHYVVAVSNNVLKNDEKMRKIFGEPDTSSEEKERAQARSKLPKTDEEIAKFNALPLGNGFTRVPPTYPCIRTTANSFTFLVPSDNKAKKGQEFEITLGRKACVVAEEFGDTLLGVASWLVRKDPTYKKLFG